MTDLVETAPPSFATRAPHSALRGLVTRYQGYRYQVDAPSVHHGLPSTDLIVVLAFDRPLDVGWWGEVDSRGRYWALASGLSVSPAAIYQKETEHGISFDLTPLGARTLLGLPAAGLRREIVALGDVIGSRAPRLYDAIAAATSWQARFAVLDRELLVLAATQDQRDLETDRTLTHAWQRIHTSAGALPIAGLAREVGWSRRHLSQRFTDEYGIGPKQAARLVRFRRARDLVAAGTRPLAEVAADCGYADQAHLTREFCDLAGDPPTTWRREERPFIQDLADDA
jgi:AraC-like DNA-binding protein